MLPGRVIPFAIPEHPSCHSSQRTHTVVQVGRDEELSRLRAMVLSSAGYTVHSIVPAQAINEIRALRETQVWVFCHTLEFYELALLASAIRRDRPGDKLLRLTGLHDVRQVPGLFDERLEPVNSIDDLLRVVANLASH